MMANKRHTAEQIIAKLREAEVLLAKGMKMPQVCPKLAVTEQTYYSDTDHLNIGESRYATILGS